MMILKKPNFPSLSWTKDEEAMINLLDNIPTDNGHIDNVTFELDIFLQIKKGINN